MDMGIVVSIFSGNHLVQSCAPVCVKSKCGKNSRITIFFFSLFCQGVVTTTHGRLIVVSPSPI